MARSLTEVPIAEDLRPGDRAAQRECNGERCRSISTRGARPVRAASTTGRTRMVRCRAQGDAADRVKCGATPASAPRGCRTVVGTTPPPPPP